MHCVLAGRTLPFLFAAAALAGCGRGVEAGGEFRGEVLAEPIPRPDFILTDTSGEPFDFRAETDGHVTLLFFGYTHCPDVCPIHMGNIAAVLGDVGWRVRQEIKVVFVTTDPARDTPARIRSWLDRFDASFIGLRGSPAEVERIQRGMGLAPSVIQPLPEGGPADYLVGHAAQVVAFGADGPARVVYPFGTRQADWAHDLPRLVAVGP
ncbi:MAG TPA: SCO family protein [Gemmatimonadota bacterium]|nr:SCO family protein [Gemmatimonadota bacterium]